MRKIIITENQLKNILRYVAAEKNLVENHNRKLLQETNYQMLEKKYKDKIIDKFKDTDESGEEIYDEAVQVSNNEPMYAFWLLQHVLNDVILPEDIYKYESYFQAHMKNKRTLQQKDRDILNFGYREKDKNRAKDEVSRFIKLMVDAAEAMDNKANPDAGGEKNEKLGRYLTKHKDLLIGKVDNFYVFQIPAGRGDLLSCSKDLGSKDWCTTKPDSFQHYVVDENEDLFIFINENNPDDKYQIGLKTNQFKDKYDNEVVVDNDEDDMA